MVLVVVAVKTYYSKVIAKKVCSSKNANSFFVDCEKISIFAKGMVAYNRA